MKTRTFDMAVFPSYLSKKMLVPTFSVS
jgi:hypothetical protein